MSNTPCFLSSVQAQIRMLSVQIRFTYGPLSFSVPSFFVGGLSGLTCARELALLGIRSVVFGKAHVFPSVY